MDHDSLSDDSQSAQPQREAAAVPGDLHPPATIADHQLLRRIGRGSYGEVWLARNMMGMYRAVKFVYRKSFQHQRPYERELSGIRKFEPISRSYEGFVDVLHVGINEEEEYFYYVMELGDDETSGQNIEPDSYSPKTLAKQISTHQKIPLQECLQLGLALSQALAELHKHNLVHRDVKPSNIIFVNGVPKLADIGLVADFSEARSYVGTEGFIPPEGPGAPQADIYSLGKVLYEAGTGKDRQEYPELPTLLDSFSDPGKLLELNEVIIHACQNDPNQRYRSAWDMHADLLVLANGKSVKRLRLLEQRLSNLKRSSGIAALVVLVAAVVAYQIYRERKRDLESRQEQIGSSIAYGNRALETGDPQRSIAFFADAFRLEERRPDKEAEHRLRFNAALARSPKLVQMLFLPESAMDAEFSPDGRSIIVAQYSGKVRVYDALTGQDRNLSFQKGSYLRTANFSSDGNFALVASGDGHAAYICNGHNLEVLHTLPHPRNAYSAKLSPDGLHVLTACSDGVVRLWDAHTGQQERSLKAHDKVMRYANFSQDGSMIVTASDDFTAIIWDAQTLEAISPPLRHGNWVKYAAFSPDNNKLVTASSDRKMRVWELGSSLRNPRIMFELKHDDEVESAQFSPDGRMIMTASLDGFVRVWSVDDLLSPDSAMILRHGSRVLQAAFSPDGRQIVTACADGTVRIWELAGIAVPPLRESGTTSADGSRAFTISKEGIAVRDTASGHLLCRLGDTNRQASTAVLSVDGHFLLEVTAGRDATDRKNSLLQVWDVTMARKFGVQILATNLVDRVAVSDDGGRIVDFSSKVTRKWETATGNELPQTTHANPIGGAFFDRAGKQLVTWNGKVVQVCDVSTGRDAFSPLQHEQKVSHAEYSPDGRYLVTCCSDPDFTALYAQVWSAATGQPVGPPLRHKDGVLYASFSPDSRKVVSAGEDFKVNIWAVGSGQRLTPPLEHKHQVWSARFSPDGKWLVTASWDKTARVWDAEKGNPLTPPLRHLSILVGARFLGDGRQLVTTDGQDSLWVWQLPMEQRDPDDLVQFGKLLSGNSVTPSSEPSSQQSESLATTWKLLRTKYPTDFTASKEQIAAWHEFKAQESEKLGQWPAAVFHLERLLALHSANPEPIRHRLDQAKAHLQPNK